MINKKIKVKIIAFFLLANTFAYCQEKYNLNQLIDIGLKNNLQIKISENNKLKTNNQIKEAKSGLLPQLSGEYNYTYYPDLMPQFLPGQIVGQPDREFVAQALGLPQTQYIRVQATQQVFNPSILIALKVAKKANQLSDLELKKEKENLIYNISATYYNLQTIEKSIELLDKNIGNLEKVLKATKVLVETEFSKKSDASRIQISIQSIQTQKTNLQTTQNQLKNILRQLLNLENTVQIEIENENIAAFPDSFLANSYIDFKEKTDLKLVVAQKELKLLEKQNTKAGYLPTLTLIGAYSRYSFWGEVNPFKQFNNQSFPVSMVQLSLNIPIFDGGAKIYKVRQHNIELDNIENQIKLLEKQTQLDINNASEKLKANNQNFDFTKNNFDLATKIFNENQKNYDLGFIGIQDIINSLNDLEKAQSDYITAFINIKLAQLELKKSTGTLLSN